MGVLQDWGDKLAGGTEDFFNNPILNEWANRLKKGWDHFVDTYLAALFGLLGYEDEDIYQYAFQVSRMIEDEELPKLNGLSVAIVNSLFDDDLSVTEAVILYNMTGYKVSLRKFMDYAETDYLHKLPSCGYKAPPVNESVFVGIISTLLIDKDYTKISGSYSLKVPTSHNWGLAQIQQYENYTDVYSYGGDDYVYVGMEEDYSDLNNIVSRAAFIRSDNSSTVRIYIDLANRLKPPTSLDGAALINYVPYQTYYEFNGFVKDNSTQKEFVWVYLFPYGNSAAVTSSGTFPELADHPDSLANSEDLMKMLPVIVLKHHGVVTSSSDAWYETANTLLDKANITLDSLLESITTDGDEADDAFFVCGLSPHSQDDESVIYLYCYFYMLYTAIGIPSYTNWSKNKDTAINKVEIVEQGYNTTILFNYIRTDIIEGTTTTGIIGEIESTVTKEEDVVVDVFEYRTDEFNQPVKAKIGEKTYDVSYVTYTRQLTSATYEKMVVHGLRTLVTIVSLDGEDRKGMITNLYEGDNLLIPLSYSFLQLYGSPIHMEKLILRSYHLVIFASDKQHLEYWQTAKFTWFVSTIIVIIGFIATAYSLGADGGGWSLLAAYVITWLFKEALKRWKLSRFQKAALIALYVYAMYKTGDTSGLLTSAQLANAIVLSVGAVTDIYIEEQKAELELLEEEAAEEREIYESAIAELKRKSEMLEDEMGTGNPLLNYKVSRKDTHDDPDSFLRRTLNRDTTEMSTDYCSIYIKSSIDLDLINAII